MKNAAERNRWRLLALAGTAVALVATPAAGSVNIVGDPGVVTLDAARVDDLLSLTGDTSTHLLIVPVKVEGKKITQEHVTETRRWLESGGVIWAEGDGLNSRLVRALAEPKVASYKFRSPTTGHPGGEMIIRKKSARFSIRDHALTEGVNQLYIIPSERLNGTKGAIALVEMTDALGEYGAVISAIPVGQGFIVLDGTARKNRPPTKGRVLEFDKNHPNAKKEGSNWNSFDWDLLKANAIAHARLTRASQNPAVGAY